MRKLKNMELKTLTPEEYRLKQITLDDRKKKLKGSPTPSEIIFREKLRAVYKNFKFQKGFIAGQNFCIVDFYIPQYRLCIEVDGEYHQTPEQIKRDRNRDWYLSAQRGFNVLHISNKLSEVLTSEKIKLILEGFALKPKWKPRVQYLNDGI